MPYEKPLPTITPATQEFWESARRHVLKVPRCPACKKLFFPPTPLCPYCFHEPTAWAQVKGKGKVYSFTTVWRAINPAFQNDVPYVLAIIELDEGVRIPSNIVGCRPEAIRVGMPVKVLFEKATDEVTIPKFTPE